MNSSWHSAARTPWTLLAAIASPWPLPPSTIPRSASPPHHGAGGGGAERRVVDGRLRVGAEVGDVVAGRAEVAGREALRRKPAWSEGEGRVRYWAPTRRGPVGH